MKRRQGIILIFFLAVFVLPIACGKKGPPFLPDREISLRIDPLQAEYKDGTFRLKGAVVDSKDRKIDFSDITGCRIYHACYPLDDPPCEGCPIQYGAFKEIRGGVITENAFSCEFPVKKKKGIHFFKVRLVGPKGEIGPASQRAKLVIVEP